MSKILSILSLLFFLFFASSAKAIYDPTTVANNRFGIHILSLTPDESSPASVMANSSGGDWGYVTIVIDQTNRNKDKVQAFFDDLRRRHLIPIVRIATQPVGENWQVPASTEATAWADFLDSLNWPIQNRYVIIYNEPNHAHEWGGTTDPSSYAVTLSQTIDALKQKSADFFVLNAGFDASAPEQAPMYRDEVKFMAEMNAAVPGIFSKLDGWVSHSYPNPDFSGKITDSGRGSIRTWIFEQALLSKYTNKSLPIFITETGWKHSEGIHQNLKYPTPDQVAEYYKSAFENIWNSNRIVAVTPFLLNYQSEPFDHFSFERLNSDSPKNNLNKDVLGATDPPFYPHYFALVDELKIAGTPLQNSSAILESGEFYKSIVHGVSYSIKLRFKNTGQSIWDPSKLVLKLIGDNPLGIIINPANTSNIEPNQSAEFNLQFTAPDKGSFPIGLQIYLSDTPLLTPPVQFSTVVTEPVSITIKASLKWKKDFSGNYLLQFLSSFINVNKDLQLDQTGQTTKLKLDNILPDQNYNLTLSRNYYISKTISATLKPGENSLDFGELEPDLPSAILNPRELWKLLPLSN